MTKDEDKVRIAKEDEDRINQILGGFEGETLRYFIVKERMDSSGDEGVVDHGQN